MSVGAMIQGGMAAYSAIGNMQAQKNIAAANKIQQDINNQIVMDDAINQYAQLSAAERDVAEKASEQLLDNQLTMIQQKENAKLLAGASGTQGASINSMLFDISQTGGANQAAIIQNRANAFDDIRKQADSIRFGARRGQDTRQISKPSVSQSIGAGMQTFKQVGQLRSALSEYSGDGTSNLFGD